MSMYTEYVYEPHVHRDMCNFLIMSVQVHRGLYTHAHIYTHMHAAPYLCAVNSVACYLLDQPSSLRSLDICVLFLRWYEILKNKDEGSGPVNGKSQ